MIYDNNMCILQYVYFIKKENEKEKRFYSYIFSPHQDTSKLDVINLKNKKGKGKREK